MQGTLFKVIIKSFDQIYMTLRNQKLSPSPLESQTAYLAASYYPPRCPQEKKEKTKTNKEKTMVLQFSISKHKNTYIFSSATLSQPEETFSFPTHR